MLGSDTLRLFLTDLATFVIVVSVLFLFTFALIYILVRR